MAGAGEEAVLPVAADGWIRITRPSGKHAARGWHVTLAVQVIVEGVTQAWFAAGTHPPEAFPRTKR
eukprot:15435200-Alexandrium_andersonii.AAC.1